MLIFARFPRTFFSAVLTAALLLSGSSQAEARGSELQTEALIGSYQCGAGAADGFQSLTLNATGDVLAKETNLYRSLTVASSPGETCEFHSVSLQASLASGPCQVGAIETSADETGESRSFQFVCRAERPTIIRLLSEASAAFLLSAP